VIRLAHPLQVSADDALLKPLLHPSAQLNAVMLSKLAIVIQVVELSIVSVDHVFQRQLQLHQVVLLAVNKPFLLASVIHLVTSITIYVENVHLPLRQLPHPAATFHLHKKR
jgi:hypothetical protein